MADGDRILQYILENRERYTRNAIRDQLLAAGHDAEAIDTAFRAADAVAQASGTLDLRPRAAAIALVGYIVVWVLFGLYLGAVDLFAALGVLAVYLGVGLLVSLAVIYSSGGLRRATPERVVAALAASLVIPFVILFGLVGFCVWFISQLRF